MSGKKKIIVAVTGASGSLYARLLLDKLVLLGEQYDEVALIFSEPGKAVWNYELDGLPVSYPFAQYNATDFFAPPASGSAGYDSMIICPCSAGTLGRIAHGTGDNLIVRAADVLLKERRKLILLFRESPLSLIHIRNMELLSQAGAIIYPASPGLYTKPKGLEEFISPLLDRILEQAGFSIPAPYRWKG
jgi:4-hydroxy-3-polyprenylbenzoate decarboxylase